MPAYAPPPAADEGDFHLTVTKEQEGTGSRSAVDGTHIRGDWAYPGIHKRGGGRDTLTVSWNGIII